MLEFRKVDVETDRELLLELHCEANYESETPWARVASYTEYREKWLSTGQPESYLKHLSESSEDGRTIAEFALANGEVAGYIWVTFMDVEDYDITIAEVNDIAVTQFYRRKGVGSQMLVYIEKLARERGARLLRSETGIENIASDRLHTKLGFKPYRIEYEKVLNDRS